MPDQSGASVAGRERFSDTCEFDALTPAALEWPVAVEVTTTYVVWQEGDTYAEAVENAQHDGDIYEDFCSEAVIDSGWSVIEKPSPWQVREEYPPDFGPLTRCDECGQIAYSVHVQSHNGTCSQYIHRAYVVSYVGGPTKGRHRADCSCSAGDTMAFSWRLTRDEAEADLAVHLAGRRWQVGNAELRERLSS